jgi:hypothetical protein
MLATVAAVIDEIDGCDESQTARLERYIKRASAKLVSLANRVWAEERVVETVRAHGRTQLILERTPLVEIHEVTYDSEVITDYEIHSREAGTLYRRSGWVWGVGLMSESSGISAFPAPSSEYANYTVDYTAGYVLPSFPNDFTRNANSVDLPEDVEEFCLQVVRLLYHARATDPSLQSERIGDYQYTRGSPITSAFFQDQAAFVAKWGRVI